MTEDDDLAVVRANSAAFSDRDVDAMLSYYATDAVVEDKRPYGLGTFHGHAELRPYYLSIFHSVDAMREHLDILAASEGVIVAHAELWARVPSDRTGAGVTAPYGMILSMRDGKIARLEVYADGREALEASGLGDS